MISYQVSWSLGGIQYKGENNQPGPTLENMAKGIEKLGADFFKQVDMVHRKSVFQILIRLIRLTPVDSGRLRGSWTPFFEAHGASSLYSGVIQNAASGQEFRPRFDSAAFGDGVTQGYYADVPGRTTIGSNVVYAGFVEARIGMLAKAIGWGQDKYRANFEAYMRSVAKLGKAPEVDVAEMDDAPSA